MRVSAKPNVAGRRCAPRGTRGQGLVELAFLLPIVALLWSALVDFGRVNVKKQQAFAALDAMSLLVANQTVAMTAEELETMGCEVLESTGALKDLGKTKDTCVADGWVDVQAEMADPSTPGQTMFPMVVKMQVPALVPLKVTLAGGTNYNARSTYDVTTGVHYVRPARNGLYK